MPPPRILHLDLDAFFASVEQRDDPTLAGRPVAVAGHGPRGVIAAASYEARSRGVRSATPVGMARRACPGLIVRPPRFAAYETASSQVFAILRRHTDLVEPVSLDEAFLDVTHHPADWRVLTTGLRMEVQREVGLVCSVGGGRTKTVAKLASAAAKPDGMLLLTPADEDPFLADLPVGNLWGVGPKTAAALAELGVATIGALAGADPELLATHLGANKADMLSRFARNDDPRPVLTGGAAKSIGNRQTLPRDVAEQEVAAAVLCALSRKVARRAQAAAVAGRTVEVQLRDTRFRTRSRQRTFPDGVAAGGTLAGRACALLDELWDGDPVRMVGVSISSLDQVSPAALATPDPEQMPDVYQVWQPGDVLDHPLFGEGVVTDVTEDLVRLRFAGRPAEVSLPRQSEQVAAGPSLHG